MKLNKYIMAAALLLTAATPALADDELKPNGAKPTVMVLPSDKWCRAHGYIKDGDVPDYRRAVEDEHMSRAITLIGNEMSSRGLDLSDVIQNLKNMGTSGAYNMVVSAKDGSMPRESERDELTRNFAVDIIAELDMNMKSMGLRKSAEFELKIIDAASGIQLGGDVGSSRESSASDQDHMKQAVGCFINNFADKINLAFDKMQARGRNGFVEFHISEDCPYSLEDEVSIDGERGELAGYIQYWLEEHTTDGEVSMAHKSDVSTSFKNVHFPLIASKDIQKDGWGSKRGNRKMRSLTMHDFIIAMAPQLKKLGMALTVVPIGQARAYCVLGSLNN